MSRSALVVGLLVVLFLGGTAAVARGTSKPPSEDASVPPVSGSGQAQVEDDPCSSLPGVELPGGVELGPSGECEAVGTAVDAGKKAGHAVTHPGETLRKGLGAVAGGVGGSILGQVASWMGEGASWLLKQRAKLIDKSTSPHVEQRWFTREYGRMVALAALCAIPMLIFAALQGVVRSDARIVAKAWLVQAPLAFLFTGIAVVVVDQLLTVSDGMSEWIAQATAGDAESFLTSVSKVFVVGRGIPVGWTILAALTAAGAVAVVVGLIVVQWRGDAPEREAEEAARDYLDRHGDWPDDPPRDAV
jgi:hypothetical protein